MEEELDNICEECKKEDESVSQNLIMLGYKICDSCRLSKYMESHWGCCYWFFSSSYIFSDDTATLRSKPKLNWKNSF